VVSLSFPPCNPRICDDTSPLQLVCLAEVNFEELARSTEDFNGAMLKAVCVEAGMIALRREGTVIKHEDFVEGIQAVQMKKKSELQYYA
jgi:26S proteasome regulatory subunit T5